MDQVAGVTPASGQNLNDLQNYLVTFNKEIEGEQTPGSQQIRPVQISSEHNKGQVVIQDAAVALAGGDSTTSQAQAVGGFYKEQGIIDGNLEGAAVQLIQGLVSAPLSGTEQVPDDTSALVGVEKSEADAINSQYQTYIADLAGDGTQIIGGLDASVSTQEISSSMVQSLMNPATAGNIIRIVSMGADGQMQFVSEEIPQGTELTEVPKELTTQGVEGIEQPDVIDGTDPVAVLASIAANTSNAVNHLQAVPVSQSEMHNAQLVALQNSADSSQPQLVAVQAGDGVDETLQVIGAAEGATDNSVVFNAGNSFQTVTIVPSEVGKDGEVSYVLIVSQPDGEKDANGKPITTDMSVFDFKEEAREISTEEIIDEDGTTKRILKITPKRAFATGSPNQLMCHYCNYTSPKRYLLSRHMKSHSEERPHKCTICERGFKTIASLTNHVNTHTGHRPHKCKDCEAAFTTSGELVRHIRYRHTFEKPHKCMVCDYASVELSKLKRHMRSHTGERPYQCPHCAYASPDTYKLKRHLRIHTGEKPYECDVCHARFTQSNSLKAHKLIHSGDKPVYQCDLCPTTCGRKTDLKIHIQKLHTSERPLVCRKCNKTFPDRYSYKMHNKNHDGEKCFKCDFGNCDYAALSQRHLDSHLLTHSGIKPFECDECDQTFRQKQLLRRHRNLHHTPDYMPPAPREKMHDCSECDRSFAHKGNLVRHLQHHGIECSMSDDEDSEAGTSATNVPQVNDQLHNNLMQDLRAGKLGNAPQVVIVHPDGRVEEFSSRLDSAEKGVDELLMAIDSSEQLNMDKSEGLVPEGGDESEVQNDEKREAGTQVEIDSDTDDDIEVTFRQQKAVKKTVKLDPQKLDPEKLDIVDLYPITDMKGLVEVGSEMNSIVSKPASSNTYAVLTSQLKTSTQTTSSINIPKIVTVVAPKGSGPVSPTKHTSSDAISAVKRKQPVDEGSPAKRTRKATADSKV
ncbi:zinc finger protein 184-like [Haliotis rubra]|uniref:zinc finger protein 184-like n=1 Tax=Haliotis rubra TaxID=36100 RepID=UPI001EE599BF|nr:zinc finger protein 184-like [Haliotis rubra]XP_046558878.1 zinc finger protein 184-like [Haliotis rubra]XP_046558880.1 zinc finger protein 184-like [Haliotis rubra]